MDSASRHKDDWTATDDALLIQMKRECPDMTWQEVGDALGRTKDAVRWRWKQLRERDLVDNNDQSFSFGITEFDKYVMKELDKDADSPIHWKKLVELATDTQTAMEALEPSSDIREWRVPGRPYPIGIFSGDWHLGHRATSYCRWLYEIAMVLRTENAFLFDLGDDRQNSRSTRHLYWVLSQVLPVELQAQVIVSVTKELVGKRKLAAKIGGTHDTWFDQGVAGQMLLKWLYQQTPELPFFENKGTLKLTVDFPSGSKSFPHLLYHKSKYKSFLNQLHGNIREYQLTMPGKVVAGAHDHEPGAMLYWHYGMMERMGYDVGGWSWLIKVGAFTRPANQFRDLGSFGHTTETFCPACVYMEDGIVLLPTLRDALAYRAGIDAAKEHEEQVISELNISSEQRDSLWKELRREPLGKGEYTVSEDMV